MEDLAEVFDLSDGDVVSWFSFCEERAWGDGLPTIPPTEHSVQTVLDECPWIDELEFAPIPPRWLRPSPRSFVANAVMAGCQPEQMPLLVAALDAVLVPDFNLQGVAPTTHPCTSLIIVSGRARDQTRMNATTNCLGPGNRANATLGRALRLVLQNIGGAVPGVMDLATQGSPAKFTCCFAENEEESPWDPYHVRMGFAPEESIVTVVAAESPHNINDHGSTSAEELIMTIAGTIATVGSNNLLVGGPHLLLLSPEHAHTLARDGWTIERIQRHLFEVARVPVNAVSSGNQREIASWGRAPDRESYPVGSSPHDLHVLVAGGPGKHSTWVPTFGVSQLVSKRVSHVLTGFSRKTDGTPSDDATRE